MSKTCPLQISPTCIKVGDWSARHTMCPKCKWFREKNSETYKRYCASGLAREKARRHYTKPSSHIRVAKYMKTRLRNEPGIRVIHNLRHRVCVALRRSNKFHRLKEVLGCTVAEFKEHLEKQWKENMTWDNYGNGRDKWNMDHIMPLSSFDMTIPEQQHAAFHYTNVQPMWHTENSRKGSNI